MKVKPLLFISYSRKDSLISDQINATILNSGYKTFYDKESIQVGDVFTQKIKNAIHKCDGCLSLVSENSIQSEWCKLENYYALFYNKSIIPLKIGDAEYPEGNPLNNLLKNINYLKFNIKDANSEFYNELYKSLKVTRKSALYRFVKKMIWVTLCLTVLLLIYILGYNNLDKVKYISDKKELISSIKSQNNIFNSKELDIINNRFSNDKEFINQLHYWEKDPTISPTSNLNSVILAGLMNKKFAFSQRMYFKDINIVNSILQNNILSNSTFQSGVLAGSDIINMDFENILFLGFEKDKNGFEFSGSKFKQCVFNSVVLDNSKLIDVEFYACRFNGSLLNTTFFGAVNFLSDSNMTSKVITNNSITSFKNCQFINNNREDPPNVIVMGKEYELQFVNVIFDNCTFSGLFRPEWFTNCFFENCNLDKKYSPVLIQRENDIIQNN